MRILLTNDDGVHAPGLKLLEKIAAKFSDDVWVVAPETDQSGVAHSFSLSNPLRLREITPRHFAVQGTPTDCVIMGLRTVLTDKQPDLILSGVNRGQNVAEDVTYSGTIALSQSYGGVETRERPHWDSSEMHAPAVIEKILALGIPKGVLINVNFPNCPGADVQGYSVTAQGKRDANLIRVEQRRDGRAIPYYWLMFQKPTYTPADGSDLEALAAGKVSITPLKLDLTDETVRERYRSGFA